MPYPLRFPYRVEAARAGVMVLTTLVAGLRLCAAPPAAAAEPTGYRGLLHGSYDVAWAVAVDAAGSSYVAGYTDSPGFPTVQAAQADYGGGEYDAFVLKIDAVGRLVYSTYLGGSDEDRAYGIAVDARGYAYVTGYTHSADFPIACSWQAELGGEKDAFIAKLEPDSGRIVWATFLGSRHRDQGRAIALDRAGAVFVTGSTDSPDFPVAAAVQGRLAGGRDAFVAQLSPDGRELGYSTFLGGTGNELAYGIALDPTGRAMLTGYTDSVDWPLAGAVQAAAAGGSDAFVAKLAPRGQRLVYSTYLGGAGDDRGWGIASDGAGNAFVAGYTESADFPTARAAQPSLGGGRDAFASRISPEGTHLVYSTFLGGAATEHAFGMAVDRDGNAAVAGYTRSADFPLEAGCGLAQARAEDGFVVWLHRDGQRPSAAQLLGGGAVKAQVAREMTAELHARVAASQPEARALGRSVTVTLAAKGIAFGRAVVRPDGSIDTARRRGIDADLVVRPFGAKGTQADLRAVVAGAAAAHLGLDTAAPGDDPTTGRLSPAASQAGSELASGDLTALVYWIARRPPPRQRPPQGEDGTARHARGQKLFGELGCAACHVPELTLEDPLFQIAAPASGSKGLWYELKPIDSAAGTSGRLSVALYSDLRRHATGKGLADPEAEAGIDRDVFLTTPLWGVGSTGPWLHDGRAATLGEAILWHGGEAKPTRDRFAPLGEEEREALVAFLEHLVIDGD
jgi:hypothetical protein